MEARRKKIEGDFGECTGYFGFCGSYQKEYEAQLANARKEAQAIVERQPNWLNGIRRLKLRN